jgi:hypothetical protein
MVCTKRMKSNKYLCVKMYGSYNTWLVRWITSRRTTTTTTTSTMDTHRLLPIIVWNYICVVTSLSPYSIVSLLCFVIVFLVTSLCGITTTCCRPGLDIRMPKPNGRNRPSQHHTSLCACVNKCIQHTTAIRNCSNVILNFCSDHVGIE